jgi:hypothetical protein
MGCDLVAFVLLIDYTPWGNTLLGTAPVVRELWVFIVPFAVAMLVLEELRKWLARRGMLFQRPTLEMPNLAAT